MPDDSGGDIDRMAERLGLVSPDLQGSDAEGADEIVVVVHISGGLVAEVGTLRRDLPRLRVVVADDDMLEGGDDEADGVWTEGVTALEDWSRDRDAAMTRVTDELPESVRRELGLSHLTDCQD